MRKEEAVATGVRWKCGISGCASHAVVVLGCGSGCMPGESESGCASCGSCGDMGAPSGEPSPSHKQAGEVDASVGCPGGAYGKGERSSEVKGMASGGSSCVDERNQGPTFHS